MTPTAALLLAGPRLPALGQLHAALAAARQAAALGFSGPELPLFVGETHLAARNYPAALDNLDRTLRLDPDQPAALFYKGLAYAATADTSTAVQYLQDALARNPREPKSCTSWLSCSMPGAYPPMPPATPRSA